MSAAFKMGVEHTATWKTLMNVITRAAELNHDMKLPLVLTSLPDLPEYEIDGPPISFIHGPPGRNIALAVGLRAAMPDTPMLLIMNADAVTLGMNHLIHAARRNMGMTLLILRSEVTDAIEEHTVKRTTWQLYGLQESFERKATPLELATSLEAASVARGSIADEDQLVGLIASAMKIPGFSMVGITAETSLPLGVLSRSDLPEYFDSYHDWSTSLRAEMQPLNAEDSAQAPEISRTSASVPRTEVRIVGIGGQGVKLSGSVLNGAVGMFEGLWATQRGEYGSATRGGPSLVDVVAGGDRVGYPVADNPDVLILLSEGAVAQYADTVKSDGHLIVDADRVKTPPSGALVVPIVRISIEYTGKPIATGVVSLGCVAAVSGVVSLESLKKSVALKLPAKLVEKNIEALVAGYEATRSILNGEF